METNCKYILSDETKECGSIILHRVIYTDEFANKMGIPTLGGWIEKLDNLSQDGDCYITEDACACGNASVYENAIITGDASVFDEASIYGNAIIGEYASVYHNVTVAGDAIISGYAEISGFAYIAEDALVSNNHDFMTFEVHLENGNYTYYTWTRSNTLWHIGNGYKTSDELIKNGYDQSDYAGKCCESLVNYVKTVYQQ